MDFKLVWNKFPVQAKLTYIYICFDRDLLVKITSDLDWGRNEACAIAAENSCLKAFKAITCWQDLPTVTCNSKEYASLINAETLRLHSLHIIVECDKKNKCRVNLATL